jgi:hypothetical protein
MSILRSELALGVLLATALGACGGSSDTSTGTGGTSSASGSGGTGGGASGGGGMGGSMPIVRPVPPQVVKVGGGVLVAPKVQPIRYATDPAPSDVDAFLQELTTTSFWSQVTSEYQVGALTVLPTIVRPDAAPSQIDDTQLQMDLVTNTTGATPAWGAADGSTIYLLLFPPGTTVTQMGARGCHDYDGYHAEAQITTGLSVPYAVGCACPGYDGPGISAIQQRTVAISHELVEAATDPFPFSRPGYAQEDLADIIWTIETGGEVADMCELSQDSYFTPPGSTYMIQRSWSNIAALAGKNPCVPAATSAPYFNSVPILPDKVTVMGGGPTFMTPGVKIPVQGKKTIDISLHSEAPTKGPWKVSAYDAAYLVGGMPELELSLDKHSGEDGDVLHLTITVLKEDTLFGVAGFVLFSDLDGQEAVSMGAVGQK